MRDIRWVVGIDISTQTIRAMLLGVAECGLAPGQLIVSSAWISSRRCREENSRKTPSLWVKLIRECLSDLRKLARETEFVSTIGVSTAFPGVFPINRDGSISQESVCLYDNSDDAGILSGEFEDALECAERVTINRMWPGNMAIGTAHLVQSGNLVLENTALLAPPNTALAHTLLKSAEADHSPANLPTDFSQAVISGVYNAKTMQPAPSEVLDLLSSAVPSGDWKLLHKLLPPAKSSWTNVLPSEAVDNMRKLLGLPYLEAISIGAGDSPLGVLALKADSDTMLNVRGSSDTPIVVVDQPREVENGRETLIHYQLPVAESAGESPWCVTAPMLRSGKVWDWVRSLRFSLDAPNADAELEKLAVEALKRRLHAPDGSMLSNALEFNTALGGERAPDWNPHATGSVSGIIEAHGVGDIAVAALEGMSKSLARCIEMIESRYDIFPGKLLLAGGPAHNALWNWITQIYTGKKTYATTFSDASLLGAAMLAYGTAVSVESQKASVSDSLLKLSELVNKHPLVNPQPVDAPDEELAALEQKYISSIKRS